MNDLVSVIIPVFNRADLLQDAVASVLSQTYRPIEVIIVDDGSTDDTPDVCRQLALHHAEIGVFYQTNQGPGVARETGRMQARGEFIQYLDSDDVLLPTKLERQVHALIENPQAGVCYAKQACRPVTFHYQEPTNFADSDATHCTGQSMMTIFPTILYESIWGTSVPLWRKQVCDEIGAWLPLINEEDVEYDARAGALGVELVYVPEFLVVQRTHDQHISAGGTTNPIKLKDRLHAREHILQHALSSGIPIGSADLQYYAKSVFLLARMCAAQGMKAEMLAAMQLATSAQGQENLPMRLYRLMSNLVGVRWTQRLFTIVETFRS